MSQRIKCSKTEIKKWIACKVLLNAGLTGFELFRLFKEGRLHPHDPNNGYRIVDVLGCYRKQKIEEILHNEWLEEGKIPAGRVLGSSIGLQSAPRTEEEIQKAATRKFETQLVNTLDVPNGCHPVSFTLSSGSKEASKQIDKAKDWLVDYQEVMAIEELRTRFSPDEVSKPKAEVLNSARDEILTYASKQLKEGYPLVAADFKEGSLHDKVIQNIMKKHHVSLDTLRRYCQTDKALASSKPGPKANT